MNKKLINFLTIIFSMFLFIIVFINVDIIKQSVISSSLLFIKNVFPILFISSIIVNIIIKSNLDTIIYKITGNIYIYIIVISMLAGCPLNAIILENYYDKKYINKKDLELLLPVTSINNPLFIYNYLKLLFNNNIAFFFLTIIYLITIITYLIIKPKLSFNKVSLSNKSLIKLPDIIKSSINNMINVFGTIVFFKAISDVILLKISPLNCTLKGIVEITQGLECLLRINIHTKIKEVISLVLLLFTGLSIHIQISNILNKSINYKYFYLIKCIQIAAVSIRLFL